jgi:hypothetical protein
MEIMILLGVPRQLKNGLIALEMVNNRVHWRQNRVAFEALYGII